MTTTRSATYTVEIHHDPDHGYEAAVRELPGCLAYGETLDELNEALVEAIGMYLSTDDQLVVARPGTEGGDDIIEARRNFELCDV